MTLENYIKILSEIVKKQPEAKKYEVVYSADDEGNYFSPIKFMPTIGHYDKQGFCFNDSPETGTENSICIN